MSDPQQAAAETSETRPQTSAEKEAFASAGQRHRIYLRGKWGLAIDTAVLWLTGYSLITKQYAAAWGQPYTPTLLFTTTGARSGKHRGQHKQDSRSHLHPVCRQSSMDLRLTRKH